MTGGTPPGRMAGAATAPTLCTGRRRSVTSCSPTSPPATSRHRDPSPGPLRLHLASKRECRDDARRVGPVRRQPGHTRTAPAAAGDGAVRRERWRTALGRERGTLPDRGRRRRRRRARRQEPAYLQGVLGLARRSTEGEAAMDKARLNVWYLLPIVVVAGLLVREVWVTSESVALLPYSEFQQLLAQQKVKEVVIEGDTIRGELKEPLKEGPNQGRVSFFTTRSAPSSPRRSRSTAHVRGPGREPAAPGVLVAGALRAHRRSLDLDVPAARPRRRPRSRAHGDWEEQGEGLRRDRRPGALRGRRRRGRGEGRAGGGRVLSQGPEVLRPPGRAHAEGRAPRRSTRHGQDAPREGRGGRGGGAVLLDQWLRVRGDVVGVGPRASGICSSRRG